MDSLDYTTAKNSLFLENYTVKDPKIEELKMNLHSPMNFNAPHHPVDLPSSAQLSEKTIIDTSQSLQKEISKEQKIIKVRENTKSRYDKEFQKIKNRESSFISVNNKTTQYKSLSASPSPAPKRPRRSASPTPPQLSAVSEKESEDLQKFYESWKELNENKKTLFQELSIASEGNVSESTTVSFDKNTASKVLKNLQRMDWTKSKLQLTPSNLREVFNKDNTYGWDAGNHKWESSPWVPFFKDKESWLKLMEELKNSEKALESYMNRWAVCGAILFLIQPWRHVCAPEKDKYVSAVSSNENAIKLHIALYLLEHMQKSK